MTESNHTPGPWLMGEPGGPSGPFYSIVNRQGNVVAMQVANEADAHLIISVLDLLLVAEHTLLIWEELERSIDTFDFTFADGTSRPLQVSAVTEMLRAAIAKANGGD